MKIVIINGSPRGEKSNTRKCVSHIKKAFPGHEYAELPVATKILKLEKNHDYLQSFIDEIAGSDVVIWSFPVYIFVVPSQLIRFLELIFEQTKTGIFKGKYTSSISTSANFYDHTAHNYMQETCEDMGMQYFPGVSPSMFDIHSEDLKKNLHGFAQDLFYNAENKVCLEKISIPLSDHDFTYTLPEIQDTPKTRDKKIVVLTDALDTDINLNNMIKVFSQSVAMPVEIANLNHADIKGGCLGCASCMANAVCVYKDGFEAFFRDRVLPAEVLIYAGTIRGRYLSSLWKKYYDRSFVNGHRPVLRNIPAGYMISGPLRMLPNLRQTIEAHCELGEIPMVGIVTDETDRNDTLTDRILAFSDSVKRMVENPWKRPNTFLGVGGHKIFRDLVYSLRDLMVADHEYYEENKLYDFPK